MLATNLKYRIMDTSTKKVIKNNMSYDDALVYESEEDAWTRNYAIQAIPNDDFVQFDIDTEQEGACALDVLVLLKSRAYVLKTDKGIHIYFRKDKPIKNGDMKLPFGIKVTIHSGGTAYN
jgi:hypothetical protein